MAITLPDIKQFFKTSPQELFRRETSVVGIDVGLSSVKMVQLRREEGRGVLETYGELSVGPYLGLEVGQAGTATTGQVVQVIKELSREANVTASRAAFSIPLRSSMLTVIEIPPAEHVKLAEVIPLEARKYIPVPVSEVVLDWWPIPSQIPGNEDKKKRPLEVLVAAVHKDVMSQFEDIGKQAGFSNSIFEIETFSAIRSSVRADLSATAVLDLGATTTKMTIVDLGVIKRSHTINKGAQDLTTALAASLNVEFAKAEEIKRKIGLVETAEDTQVLPVVSPIVEYIFSEVNKVMVKYGQSEGRSIDRIVLLGGGALIKGLLPIAKAKTGIDVSISSPFDRVATPAFLNPVLTEVGPSFGVATGLALRGLQDL